MNGIWERKLGYPVSSVKKNIFVEMLKINILTCIYIFIFSELEFNRRVQEFNDLVLAESFRRDNIWVWQHVNSLTDPDHSLDGVHLTPRGMELYVRTLRRIISFSYNHFWL